MSQQIEIGEYRLDVDGNKVVVRDAAGWVVETVDVGETQGLLRLPNGALINLAEMLGGDQLAQFQTAAGAPAQDPGVLGTGVYISLASGQNNFDIDGSGVLGGTDLAYLLVDEDVQRPVTFDSSTTGKNNGIVHRPDRVQGEDEDDDGLVVADRPGPSDVPVIGRPISGPETESPPSWNPDEGSRPVPSANLPGGDNGHGNDEGGIDTSNPGNGGGPQASGNNGRNGGNGSGGGSAGDPASSGDNGHGNDDGGVDPSNPGNGNGVQAGGNNGGNGGNGASGSAGDPPSSQDNGHGNDEGGVDPSNPGNGNGAQAGGNNGAGGNAPSDHDNGHGNDAGGYDPSNPGSSTGIPDNGQGKGAHPDITDLVAFDSDQIFALNGKTKTFGAADASLHAGEGIDIIDATNGAQHAITLSIGDILSITDDDNHLTILGGKGDTVTLTGDGTGTWDVIEVTADSTIYSWSNPASEAVVEISNQVQANIT